MQTILIIDDEPQIRKLLQITLESQDFNVLLAGTAREGIHVAVTHSPDLILLDLGLPDMRGHQLLTELRDWYTRAIIILSVQNSEHDIVTALDNGATDYLTKPFRTGELLARIRAGLRRMAAGNEEAAVISTGNIEIDLSARVVLKGNEHVKLTNTEFQLLALLARNTGRVLTHQFLLREIWGVNYQTETQYLRVFIAQLRKKLEEEPSRPIHLITESGVGYRFV